MQCYRPGIENGVEKCFLTLTATVKSQAQGPGCIYRFFFCANLSLNKTSDSQVRNKYLLDYIKKKRGDEEEKKKKNERNKETHTF